MVCFSSDQHSHETSSSIQGNLIKPFYKTDRYGKYSITVSVAKLWIKIRKQLENTFFNLIQDGTFWGCSQMWWCSKRPPLSISYIDET